MADDLMKQLMDELSKDGKPVGYMQCNNCGLVSAFHPTDVTAEQLEKEGKATIMRMKEYFKEQGWVTAWGFDLCPECVKAKGTEYNGGL